MPPSLPLLTSSASEYGLSDARQDSPGLGPADGRYGHTLKARLDGASILVVEDEAIVALDITFALTDAGAAVLGPAVSLSEAVSLARGALRIDGAILDINLSGEEVFDLADLLVSRSVPFLFHTGGAPVDGIETRFPEAALLRKPVAVEDLLLSLAERMCRGE